GRPTQLLSSVLLSCGVAVLRIAELGVAVLRIARYFVELGVEVRLRGQDILHRSAGPRMQSGRGQTAAELQEQVTLRKVRDVRVLSRDFHKELLAIRKYSDACEGVAHHEAQQQAGEQRPLAAGLHPSLDLRDEPRLHHFGRHDRARL
ncbi:hypothetical protein V8C86DRAFT_3193225, partial [Haematococcus lacustris]